MATPIKIVVKSPIVSSEGVTIPLQFQGLPQADAQKAANVVNDLSSLVGGGHVNFLALAQLAMDLGLIK
jgi:hypothetical protein